MKKYEWIVMLCIAAALGFSLPGQAGGFKKLLHPGKGKNQEQVATCVRQRAWMAYLQDDEGELAPVRDTQNTDNDEEWLGLRFTDYDGPRIRLGVLKVLNKSAEAEGDHGGRIEVPVAGIQEMLTAALYSTKRFDVIEQKRVQEVIDQQTRKDITEPSPSAIRNMGKVLGAQYLVYGTVNEWAPDRANHSMGPSRMFSAGKHEAEVAITFSLTDVGSGQILFTTAERARLTEWGFKVATPDGRSGETSEKTPVSYAVHACANKAALKIAMFLRDRKWKGSVVNIKKNDYYINAGSQQGMAPETMLSVQSVLGIVKDPQSGTILGEDLRAIATLKVIAVQNGFSVARWTIGSKAIKPGDRVELATPPVQSPSTPECAALDTSGTL